MKITKKPITVEAWRLTGEEKEDQPVLIELITAGANLTDDARFTQGKDLAVEDKLHGWVPFSFGDWIIKGVEGEFYPCDHEVLMKTYNIHGDEEVPADELVTTTLYVDGREYTTHIVTPASHMVQKVASMWAIVHPADCPWSKELAECPMADDIAEIAAKPYFRNDAPDGLYIVGTNADGKMCLIHEQVEDDDLVAESFMAVQKKIARNDG